jgi:hypothetical protein
MVTASTLATSADRRRALQILTGSAVSRRVFYLSRNHYPCKKNMPEPSTADTSKQEPYYGPCDTWRSSSGESSLKRMQARVLEEYRRPMRNIPSLKKKRLSKLSLIYSIQCLQAKNSWNKKRFFSLLLKGFDGPQTKH